MLNNMLNQSKPCTDFCYDLFTPHYAMFNNETAEIIQFIKATKNIELDFLQEPEGFHLNVEISQMLHRFCSDNSLNYSGPTLLFSKNVMQNCFEFLQKLQNDYQVKFLMAAKSSNEPTVFSTAAKYLSGFDVSNFNEYQLLPSSLEDKIIFVTAPVLSSNLSTFMNKGNKLCFTVNSLEQYEQFAALDTPYDYCIRLDAAELLRDFYEAIDEKTQISHFGTSPHNLAALKKMINPHFRGFHMHSGKAEGNPPQAYEFMAQQALLLAENLNVDLHYLNLGGGIVYLSQRELNELIMRIREIVPSHIQLFFEPGRFLTKNAGYAVTRIESVNLKNDCTDIILDISSQCHLRWTDPMLIAPIDTSEEKINLRLFGSTCAEIDYLGDFKFPSQAKHILKRGNILLLGGITGYSASWNRGFNGIMPANIIYY